MVKYSSKQKRDQADVLFIPYIAGKPLKETCPEAKEFDQHLKPLISSKDYQGKKGELFRIYLEDQPEKRICLIGLGKNPSIDDIRFSYAKASRSFSSFEAESANVFIPQYSDPKTALDACFEGLLLGNYVFSQYKAKSQKDLTLSTFSHLNLITSVKSDALDKIYEIAQAVHFTRDLVNTNADEMNPDALVKVAKTMAKNRKNLEVEILDKKAIEDLKMGLLLAVNKGSHLEPKLIVLSYKGDPSSKDTAAFLGKGVTYDTGGLSLKPTQFMMGMKADMGGAASVLGLMDAVSRLQIKKNILVVVPTTENAIDGKSYKVGDVYTGYSGKTVEIDNTDAEGRLILADALAYTVKKYQPTFMVDLATLTGAIVVALGEDYSGLFSDNDPLRARLLDASTKVNESFWPMPLHRDYLKLLKSDFADIKNSGSREAGSITAALFLKEFTEDTPWAHIDIAGTAFRSRDSKSHPKNATGEPVRALFSFVENLDEEAYTKIKGYAKQVDRSS